MLVLLLDLFLHVLVLLILFSIVCVLSVVVFVSLLYFNLYVLHVLLLVSPICVLPLVSKVCVLCQDPSMYRVWGTIVLQGTRGAFFGGVKGARAYATNGLLTNRMMVAKHLCGYSTIAPGMALGEVLCPLVKVGGPTSTKKVGVSCRGCTKGAGLPNWLTKARRATNTWSHGEAMAGKMHPIWGWGG